MQQRCCFCFTFLYRIFFRSVVDAPRRPHSWFAAAAAAAVVVVRRYYFDQYSISSKYETRGVHTLAVSTVGVFYWFYSVFCYPLTHRVPWRTPPPVAGCYVCVSVATDQIDHCLSIFSRSPFSEPLDEPRHIGWHFRRCLLTYTAINRKKITNVIPTSRVVQL